MIIFRVNGYIPNERVDIAYAVKNYQVLNLQTGSPGFDWTRKNSSQTP
jgi:hypothetical protein